MGMRPTVDVLNAMEADGIIGRYALAGGVAAAPQAGSEGGGKKDGPASAISAGSNT